MCGGGTGQGDGDHVAFVAGDAVLLQLGDEAGVLRVLEKFSNLLVLLRVHLHVVLRQATFAIPADFSAVHKIKQLKSLHELLNLMLLLFIDLLLLWKTLTQHGSSDVSQQTYLYC